MLVPASSPLVSVIVPTYNSSRFVVSAVESVLSQLYRPIEIIVVDDGSTDETAKLLEPFFDRIRYIFKPNGGTSQARNRGISEATGELISFLDADDTWLPEKIRRQVDCYMANPSIGLIHCDVLQRNERDGQTVHVRQDRERFSGRCYAEFLWANLVCTSSVMIPRAVLKSVGVFDEFVRGPSTEDMDLWLRIARGHELGFVKEPLVCYRVHSENGSSNIRRMLEDEYYVLAKTLRADPGLFGVVDRLRIDSKLRDLAFSAGYANLEEERYRKARDYFRASTKHGSGHWRTRLFSALTLLPAFAIRPLKRIRRRLAARNACDVGRGSFISK